MTSPEQDYSLREKKFVKTKVALMQAFMERLKTTRFANISIKEVCESVEVSEGTFYNYFPKKVDIVYYYENFASVKIAWEISRKRAELTPWHLIRFVFELISVELQPPYLFYEMISIFTAEQRRPEAMQLSSLEKEYGYPDCPGIGEVGIGLLEGLLDGLVKEAQNNSEIDPALDPRIVMLALMTIMTGLALTITIEDFANINDQYQKQLSFLYKAIGVK